MPLASLDASGQAYMTTVEPLSERRGNRQYLADSQETEFGTLIEREPVKSTIVKTQQWSFLKC